MRHCNGVVDRQFGLEGLFEASNQFCDDRGGTPFELTREIGRQAQGDRPKIFAETRRLFEPDNGLLNDKFRNLLA